MLRDRAWRAAAAAAAACVACSSALVIRSWFTSMAWFCCRACSAIRRTSAGSASSGIASVVGSVIGILASPSASTNGSSVSSWCCAKAGGKKLAPGRTDGDGDRESRPRPKPRGRERTCSTERCVKSCDARVSRSDMEYHRSGGSSYKLPWYL